MTEKNENVICSCCGAIVQKGKFCPECGGLLETFKVSEADEKTVNISGLPGTYNKIKNMQDTRSQRKALSDKGLTLLVNTCKKTVATIGGDGYTESVLYLNEATGEYSIHTYSKYVYMEEGAHASYATTPEFAKKVLDYIEEHNVAAMRENKGFPLCGGDYVINFKYHDEWIHLDSGNMMDNMKAYYDLSNMLNSQATEENRLYAD